MPPTNNEPSSVTPDVPETNAVVTPPPENTTAPVPVTPTPLDVPSAPVGAPQPKPRLFARLKLSGRQKLLVLAALGTALLLGGGASAYYFGVVAPSQPENLWQTALARTADGYDSMVELSKQSKDMKGTSLTGDYKLEGSFKTDGTFELQTYDQSATFKADIGFVGSRMNVEGRMIDAPNSANPDIYFRVSGLKGIGPLLGEYAPIAEPYDNQWIAIDHTLFDNLGASGSEGTQSQTAQDTTITAEDWIKIYEVIGKVNREYVFTTDSQKAVLTVVKQVGKESKDGRDVYHYQAGLHKQHTKDYLNALVDSLQDTPATKLTNGRKLREVIDMNALQRAVDGYKDTDTAHVYVDLGTKLISRVRLEVDGGKQGYFEVGQNYTGGDVIPFVLTWYGGTDSPGTLHATANFNKKANTSEGNITYEVTEGGEKSKLSAKYKITAHNNPLKVEKPEGAKSMYELLGPMLGDLFTSGGGDAQAIVDELQI